MWSRFLLLGLCCLVAVNSGAGSETRRTDSDAIHSHDENRGNQSPVRGEGTTFRPSEHGQHEGMTTHPHGNREQMGFSGNPVGGGDRLSHSGGSHPSLSNVKQESGMQGVINFPKNGEESLSGGHRPTSMNPLGGEHFQGRPNQQSFHNADGHRPTGQSTQNFNENDRRPTGITSDKDGMNRPMHRPTNQQTEFGSTNEGGQQTHRPTDHHTESRPINEGSLTHRPTDHNTEYRPNNEGNRPTHRPTDQHTDSQGLTHRPTNEGESFTTNPSKETTGKDKDSTPKEEEEEEKEVCFPALGCFSMGKPWKSVLRPIGAPFPPEKIGTTIFFYSRANLEKQKNITLHPHVNMGEAQFDPSKITAIIVHGFSNSGNATWMKDMKNVYLNKVDANVMIVDWGKGAQLLNYLQVAGNTRVVGKQLGKFVNYLREHHGADPGKFHLIGHSLGAQICSYLAKDVPGIARLTALDPAQPGFEGFDKEVRLDPSDAEFVDVVHTDARPFLPTLGFGMIAPHGHVDFYMNGGFDQPGCVPPPKKELPSINNFLDFAKYPVEVLFKTVACPHGRAYEYLIESFNETEKCIFWGHKADVKNVLKSVTNTVTQGLLKKFVALSSTCSKEDCIPVGFATKKSPLRGAFVVTTSGRQPYCISEPGIPPETPPAEGKKESFIQKIGKKTKITG